MRFQIQVLAVIAAFSAGAAQAQEWPRLHIGAAAGSSHLGPASDGVPEQFRAGLSEHPFRGSSASSATGRKVVAGFRPTRVVGAEVQYVNLGSERAYAASTGQVPDFSVYVTTRADAVMLAALLYVPEPLPLFDVYGKVGVAKLEESFFIQARDNRLRPEACRCSFEADEHETVARPYVGIGARFKVGREIGVRVEYEAIDRDSGDSTTLLSLGVAWER